MRATDQGKQKLQTAIHESLTKIGLDLSDITDTEIYDMLSRPPEKHMGDFAFPCFRFAKLAKKNPAIFAKTLQQTLLALEEALIVTVETKGGFVNVGLDTKILAAAVLPGIYSDNFFQQMAQESEKHCVMIEYSQPNTHKIFHVGHMRNVALGDSLRRIYEYCGKQVIPVNYIGDEGTHIAKCLWYIEKFSKTIDDQTSKGAWLGQMYTQASVYLAGLDSKEKKICDVEISQLLGQIEKNTGPIYEKWLETRQWSMDLFHEVYDWLGAKFDHIFYESEMTTASHKIVDEYLEKGIFVEDQGAIGVDLSADKCGFALLRKTDGNTLYLTKDLALAKKKFEDFHIEKSIYVVASEQNLHFRQAFKILSLMGFRQAANCYHLSYGMVVGKSGKMSSRQGNIVPFEQLQKTLAKEFAIKLQKYHDEWTEQEIELTTKQLSLGAIKHGMLCTDAGKDIVFDIEDWTNFEGNTGPYLMYAYARASSLLRKAEDLDLSPSPSQVHRLISAQEHSVILALANFNETVAQACQSNKPSMIAHYLFELCKIFNRFHKTVPVLKNREDQDLVRGRLCLIKCFQKTLFQGLDLLGITPPQRM